MSEWQSIAKAYFLPEGERQANNDCETKCQFRPAHRS